MKSLETDTEETMCKELARTLMHNPPVLLGGGSGETESEVKPGKN